jgi:hypothetical protein
LVFAFLDAYYLRLERLFIPFRVIDVTTPQRPQPTRSNR